MSNVNWKQQYTTLVQFLGTALGPDYEIVLHDLSGGEHKIIAIANQHVSGRNMDASLSQLALSFILNKSYKTQDSHHNYEGISTDNRKLRCSTMFIKDEHSELLGMLCINFNASKYAKFAGDILGFVQQNFPMPTPTGGMDLVENFSDSVSQRFDTVVFELFGEAGLPDKLSQHQKLMIIDNLEQSGVFMVKGAIAEIADLIGSSVASVYRYIGMVKKGQTL